MKSSKHQLYLALAVCFTTLNCQAGTYEINTFLNVGAATHSAETGEYLQQISNRISYEYDTSYGINFRTQLTENVNGVAQLTSASRNGDFGMDLEWGFVEYAFSRDWRLRIGKMNLQTFNLSDYIEVGYLYPWIRPPEEVYGFNPMRNYPGIEIMHTARLGKNIDLISMLFTGSAEVQLSEVTTMRAEDGYGVNFQLTMPGFMVRAGSITPVVEIQQEAFLLQTGGTPIPMPGANIDPGQRLYLTTFGLSWDYSNFVGYGEWVKTTPQGALHEVFPKQKGAYLTMGYKIGNFLPFVTAATADADVFTGTITQGEFQPIPGRAQDSVSLGLRYEVNDFAALKLEVKKVDPKLYAIQVNIPGPSQIEVTPNAGFLFGNTADEDYSVFSMSYNMIF